MYKNISDERKRFSTSRNLETLHFYCITILYLYGLSKAINGQLNMFSRRSQTKCVYYNLNNLVLMLVRNCPQAILVLKFTNFDWLQALSNNEKKKNLF